MIKTIIGIVILLTLSAFFSATETAFTSVNKIRIKSMSNDGDKRAKRVLDMLDDYDSLLSTILIGNNIVNIALAAMATVMFIQFWPDFGTAVSTACTTIVVLIFGEVSPKSLAKEHAEGFSKFSAPIIKIFMYILYPANFLFGAWKKLLSIIFNTKEKAAITEDELITIVEEAETEGGIDEAQSELIQNAIEFNELEAWDVLTPRVDIQAIDIDTPNDEICQIFLETGFSRLPVYENELDNVLGVLNEKDFHNFILNENKPIKEYVKPVIFVAGSIKIALLLKKLQEAKTHMAIIVDEYGGTSGLVTMEDIIEELVGEIYDEHDAEEEKDIVKQLDGSYRVLAGTNIDKMFEYFDVEEDMDCQTVNGWVVFEVQKLPAVGDSFTYEADYKRFEVTVTKADERKALEIKMIVTELPREE